MEKILLDRFTKVYGEDKELLLKKIEKYEKNKKEQRLDTITSDFGKKIKDSVVLNLFQYSIDKKTAIIKPFMIDIVDLEKKVGIELIVRYYFYLNQVIYEKYPEGNIILIIDCDTDNSKLNSFYDDYGKSLYEWINKFTEIAMIAKETEPFYPDTFIKINFINTPVIFSYLFSIASVTIPKKTLDKISIE